MLAKGLADPVLCTCLLIHELCEFESKELGIGYKEIGEIVVSSSLPHNVAEEQADAVLRHLQSL